MGNVLAAGGNGQTIEIPAGTTNGTVALAYHDLTYRGADRATCTLKSDAYNGAGGLFVAPFPPSTPTTAITAVDPTGDWITAPGHGLARGRGPIYFYQSGGALPGGISGATVYFVYEVDGARFRICTALADVAPHDITSAGSGTLTFNEAVRSLTIENCTLDISPAPLVVNDFTFEATAATDLITCGTVGSPVAHGLLTGDGPIRFTNSGGALPAGLATATDYWVIKWTSTTFKVGRDLRSALQGVAIDITGAGTGTHTASDTASTERTSVIIAAPTSEFAGPRALTVRNVDIVGTHSGAFGIYLQQVLKAECTGVRIFGDGIAVSISDGADGGGSAIDPNITLDVEVYGGRGGVIVANQPTVPTKYIDAEYYGEHDYWQSPCGDTSAPASFSATGCVVADNKAAYRALYDVIRAVGGVSGSTSIGTGTLDDDDVLTAQITGCQAFDRVEDATGKWAQVIGVDGNGYAILDRWHRANSWRTTTAPAVNATLTAYRLYIGRLFDWYGSGSGLLTTPGALGFSSVSLTDPHWETITGGTITCVTKANLADTDCLELSLYDVRSPLTPVSTVMFEFDTAGNGVASGHVQVNVSTDTTAAQVAARLRTAILASFGSYLNVVNNGDGTLTLGSLGVHHDVLFREFVANAGFLAKRCVAPTLSTSLCGRVDMIRGPANPVLDVDIGPIHFTTGVRDSILHDSYSRGGCSDQFTDRGTNDVFRDNFCELGQDQGNTHTGDGLTVERCMQVRGAFNGIDHEGTRTVYRDVVSAFNDRRHNGSAIEGYGIYSFSASYRVENLKSTRDVDGMVGGTDVDGSVATYRATSPARLTTASGGVSVSHVGSGTVSGGVLSFAALPGDVVYDANGVTAVVEAVNGTGLGVVGHWRASSTSYFGASEPGGTVNAYRTVS